MRSSLSRSKLKCIHEGTAPCQRCRKLGNRDCALTRPVSRTPRSSKARRKDVGDSERGTRTPRQIDDAILTAPRTAPDAARRQHTQSESPTRYRAQAKQQPLPPSDYTKQFVSSHIDNLSNSVILQAVNLFINTFPELAILHLPTFIAELHAERVPESKVLLGAVLAVTKAQLSVQSASWADELLSREHYALYAKDVLSDFILQPPKVQIVQALLIITLHEWGTRDFHKAWVYCGIAIRIMQALHSLRAAPYPLDMTSERRHDSVSLAVETRTYWACFIMDCMVNSGTYTPPMLPMSEMEKMRIARPLSAVEFAFGPDAPPQAVGGHHSLAGQSTGMLDVTQSFEILVGGFDIWAQVMTFIFNDGRRAPGMCAPQNCPWVPGSPWSQSRSQLEAWRAGQHRKLHYPSNSVAVHMTLGFGETFVYLNLLYYVSTLMLHREYFPFLPTPESEPRGPVDQPMLEAPAPEGWWNESSRLLFGAAEHIATVLHEASECGVHLMTPFTGFCAFSAGYLNLYVSKYPRMNLDRSPRAKECLKMCLDYLEKFRHVWNIADGWIKTIHHASVLYERATEDRTRYQGRTRADFDTLHQSVHEFRVVDRSDEHSREIRGAERPLAPATSPYTPGAIPEHELDTNTLLNQLFAEVSNNLEEQGAWSQWWPAIEQVDLQSTGHSMPMAP
ncbi:Transcription factor, fungi, partial [Metarhizium majus ARSEF 297]